MIYLPSVSSYPCVYVRGQGVVRAYKQQPYYNSVVQYRDYYIDSHYTYTDGEQSFSQYSTLPVCLASNELTDRYMYRNDIADILLTFVLFVGIIWFLISKLIKTFFRGFKRY